MISFWADPIKTEKEIVGEEDWPKITFLPFEYKQGMENGDNCQTERDRDRMYGSKH